MWLTLTIGVYTMKKARQEKRQDKKCSDCGIETKQYYRDNDSQIICPECYLRIMTDIMSFGDI